MAIARFLLPKSELRFDNRGFVRSTRWWSSSSSSSSSSGGRKDETVSDSEASANKDTSHTRGRWCSLEGVLTTLKQKVLGKAHLVNKTSGEELGLTISARLPEVSAKEYSSGDKADMTASEVVSLLKDSEETKCHFLSIKESSDSEMASQSISECVSGIETSRENEENISVKIDQSKSSLDGSESAQKKVVELVSVEKLHLSEEPRSEDDSLPPLTSNLQNETSGSGTYLGEIQQDSEPEIGQTHQEKSPQIKIEDFGKYLKSDQGSNPLLMSEPLENTSRTLTGIFRSGVTLSGNRNNQFGMKLFDPVQKIKSNFKANDMLASSDILHKTKLLDGLLKGAGRDQRVGDMESRESKSTVLLESSKNTSVLKAGSVGEETLGIKSLLDCIKLISNENVKDTERIKPLSNANLQNPKAKRSKSILKGESISNGGMKSNGGKEEETAGAPLVVQNESVCSQATVASSTKQKKVKKSSYAFSIGEFACKTVLVRFLHQKIEKKDIFNAFDSCGIVLEVQEVASSEGCLYRDALVTFGTNAAFRMALKKTDMMVRSFDVVVEATSLEDMVDRISIPKLIGDPDVPVALVKEPTRTVKIQPLTLDINSNQVKEAFAFCGSNISNFFLGSLSSAAFVEFETEDAKERAIAEHSISIAGKQLFISRIDVPRTTVIRVSNLSKNAMKGMREACVAYGHVKKVVCRNPYEFDVHFKLAEWPNMLNILNSLNGKEIDGKRWVVQPAPVIPPEVLSILWEEPEGKRYVKEVIMGLLRKLEQPPHTAHIRRIVSELL